MPSTQQAWDEVFQLLSWWDSERVANATVMVVGAGALGNEVLKNLALLNVGRIFLIDFDEIEYSNLSRSVLFRESDLGRKKAEVAAERTMEINPNCRVEYITGDVIYDVGLGLINTMDVIIGCLDNRVARLYINRYAHRLGKTWINGGILNLSGVLDVFVPGISCYECRLKPREWDIIRKRISCTDVAKRNANEGRLPTTPISASIIGAMQVQEAFKVIYGNTDSLLAEQRYFYDGQSNESVYYPTQPLKEDCLSHESWDDITPAPVLTNQVSVGGLLEQLSKLLDVKRPVVLLEYDIVLQLYSEESDRSTAVVLPRFRITDEVYRAHQFIAGEKVRIPPKLTLNQLDEDFPQLDLSLEAVGIPPWQILRVETEKGYHLVELSGDGNRYFAAPDAAQEPEQLLTLNSKK